MISIRKRLLVSILTVIIIITALLAVATYFSIREEMDELYDENMKQVAISLARMGDVENIKSYTNASNNKLKGEEEFLIQIWKNEKITYSSHPSIEFSLQQQGRKNFGRIHFEGSRWRYYQARSKTNIVQVSQDLSKRHDVIVEIYRVLVIPILIQIPVLIGLIWFLVGYGFRPLKLVSDNIRKRTPSFLEPIPDKNVPTEIQVMVGALNDLLIRLKSALDAQRQFTGDAAHELRTPLTAIRLQLDILKRSSTEEERKDSIISLDKGIIRSIRLVEQLLEMARQEPESTSYSMENLNISGILKDVIEQSIPLSRNKNIEMSFHSDEGLLVLGNIPQLTTLFSNLINNAILYTPENGKVSVSSYAEDKLIIVDVADNGIGISEPDRQRIFDRFYRVAGTNVIGSGLGLSIVSSIAAFHRAEISIHQGLSGQGTTFRVKIPVTF